MSWQQGNRYTPGAQTRLCQSTGEVAATGTGTVSPTHHRTPPLFPLFQQRDEQATAVSGHDIRQRKHVRVGLCFLRDSKLADMASPRHTKDSHSQVSRQHLHRRQDRKQSLLSSSPLAQHFASVLLCNVLSVNNVVVNTPSLHLSLSRSLICLFALAPQM